MTNVQLYIAVGVPSFMVILGILAGIYQNAHLNNRFTSLETNMNARFTSIDSRFTSVEARFTAVEARMTLVQQDLKDLVKSTNELDVRLARLEERTMR